MSIAKTPDALRLRIPLVDQVGGKIPGSYPNGKSGQFRGRRTTALRMDMERGDRGSDGSPYMDGPPHMATGLGAAHRKNGNPRKLRLGPVHRAGAHAAV